LTLEPGDDERLPPLDRLWLAVLCQLLADAAAHRAGGLPRSGTRQDGEAALAQVAECGDQLRYVCGMSGLNPRWVSKKFLASAWLPRRRAVEPDA
jgi:hypothetical protein